MPEELRDQLALAVGQDTYRAYRQLQDSERWQRLAGEGARAAAAAVGEHLDQGPAPPPTTLYVHGLAAPFTVNTMPDDTLEAFADHGEVGEPMPADGGDCDEVLARFARGGRRRRGAGGDSCRATAPTAFVDAWKDLIVAHRRPRRHGACSDERLNSIERRTR